MDEDEKWTALIRSINRAGKILNIDLTEKVMPQPMDWEYASELNRKLWDQVILKRLASEGTQYSDRYQFCHEFGKKAEPYLCHECLDRIIRWLNSKSITELAQYPLRINQLLRGKAQSIRREKDAREPRRQRRR